MKQKILNCLKFGILVFGISLVLFNCQTDNSDELIQFEKGNNTAFKKGKLQDYDDLSTYIENLKRRRASIISSAESDIEDAYDFTIIQDQDMQIYDEGGSITYNIPIHKTNEEVDIFSNLVIKFSDIEPTQAFILNYEPYDGYFEDVEQNSQTPFSGYVSSQLLEYDGSLDDLAETDGGCITVTTKYCDWENNQHGAVHIATSNCTEGYMFYVSTTYCFGDAPQLVDVPSPSSSGFPYIPSGGGSSGDGSYEHPVIIPTVPSTAINLDIDGITFSMNEWLNNNPRIKAELYELHIEEPNNSITNSFILELIIFLSQEVSAELQVVKFIIRAYKNDKIDNDFDIEFLTTVLPDLDIHIDEQSTASIATYEVLITYFTVKCAVLRFNHPNWSNIRIYYEASKDFIHITLDVFGLVPVLGEVADLANGVLYSIEGDGVNATLSYASAIPFYGWITTGTKLGIRVVNTTSVISTKIKLVWKITSDGIIEFGRRSQLRKVLGLPVGDPRQAHHLIPWATQSHEVIQLAARSGNAFHMNEALNGIAVAAWRNQPNHNLYNQRVTNRLNAILATNPNIDQAYQRVSELTQTIRDAIINNPNTHFNDLIF